jgi:chromosome segregation ATPase
LRAENAELKQKLRDYDLKTRDYEELHVKFMELEHRMKLHESEKYKYSMESKSSEFEVHKKVTVMEESVRKGEEMVAAKQSQLIELDRELIRTKEMVTERNREITRLRALLEEGSMSYTKYTEERMAMERELNLAIEGKKSIQIELERLISINERLTKTNKDLLDRDREYSFESTKYNKSMEEFTHQIDMFKYQLEQKSRELEIAIESRRSIQTDIEKYATSASKCEEEVYRLTKINKEYEEELVMVKKRVTETLSILSSKEEELRTISTNMRLVEEKSFSFNSNYAKLEHDYAIIKQSLEVREEELMRLRKMRDEESSRRMSFESEYKKMESLIQSKDMEIKSVRMELERMMTTKETIFEERTMLITEFEALKEHVKVLETQNMSVSSICITLLATPRTRQIRRN